MLQKIKRGINHYYTKFQSFLHEKEFRSNGQRVKYMFYPQKESETLIVSFPACAPNTAKYNYMRTLLPFKENKLFLLDDFGSNHQGCYLIEENVEKCTQELLAFIIKKCGKKLKNIIFAGSSKGGYIALNFAFLFENVKVIIGSPQYFLGSYLDKNDSRVNLEFLIGEITPEKKSKLDERLKNRIFTSKIKPENVRFHYSNVEEMYEIHTKYLLEDLKSVSIPVWEDVQNYPTHSGLGVYFPPYLAKQIKDILSE